MNTEMMLLSIGVAAVMLFFYMSIFEEWRTVFKYRIKSYIEHTALSLYILIVTGFGGALLFVLQGVAYGS